MAESRVLFGLDCHDVGPSVVFSKDKQRSRDSCCDLSLGMNLDLNQSHQPEPLPHSPSSPNLSSDLSASSAGMLLTSGLVKSSSTDLRSGESAAPRGKPLLSLVKSLSTEISRRVEPDATLSKSDSKLHLYPSKLATHPKIPEMRPELGPVGEKAPRVSPPSTSRTSPTEPRGSSLIAELEGTRRKFSEAMHDQLSMLSKIMGEESSGSPKQGRDPCPGDSPGPQGSCEREGSSEESDLRWRKRTESDSPLRRLLESTVSPEHYTHSREGHLEICSYGDVLQVLELQNGSSSWKRNRLYSQSRGTLAGSTLPLYWLFPVGLLAYGLFVLPLPQYVAGLSAGIACGFILGLVAVFMFAPRHGRITRKQRYRSSPTSKASSDRKLSNTAILEGWMNEAYSYDPETFHPSLTHSVYVTLDGSRLRLAYPCANISQWAAFDEELHEASFLHSLTYQLANSKVSLVPSGLARKRVWNKKYPICIALAKGEVEAEESFVEELEDNERQEKTTLSGHPFPVSLYLFGRTGRDKEEWFQHLESATKGGGKSTVSPDQNADAKKSNEDADKESTEEPSDLPLKTKTLLDYSTYMAQVIGSETFKPVSSPSHSDKGGPSLSKTTHAEDHASPGGEAGGELSAAAESGGGPADGHPTWVNSLVGRIFWDFLREKYWADQVAHKIQKKLGRIKLPYFMNELTLSDLDMGTCLPQVLSTSKPTLDRRGLWLDLELVYTGGLHMTLETKMNLCKLGKEGVGEPQSILDTLQLDGKSRLILLADSDEESSSAGSSNEEEVFPSENQGGLGDKPTSVTTDGHIGGSTGRKFLRFVDKIAKSKYFQKATENEYIKKKIAEVSNMPLMLSVEVLELSGTLAINIPPPPTDRIWYSFRVPPTLDLHVRPMLGERELTFTHVTEWIEKKLQCEFQKVFVMPNMDDLHLPLMTSGLENLPASHNSSERSSSHQSSVECQEYMSE